jgi:hypothetical protein
MLGWIHVDPTAIEQRLQVNVLELARIVIASDDESSRVADRLEKCGEQHDLVVAISDATL